MKEILAKNGFVTAQLMCHHTLYLRSIKVSFALCFLNTVLHKMKNNKLMISAQENGHQSCMQFRVNQLPVAEKTQLIELEFKYN